MNRLVSVQLHISSLESLDVVQPVTEQVSLGDHASILKSPAESSYTTSTSCIPSPSTSTINGAALTYSVCPKSTSHANSASAPSIILRYVGSDDEVFWTKMVKRELPAHLSDAPSPTLIEAERSAIGVESASVPIVYEP